MRATVAGRKPTRTRAGGAFRRSLFSHTPDIVALVDAGGIVQEISPSVERLLGHRAAEIAGGSGFAILHPHDRRRVARFFADLVRVPGAVRSIQFRARDRSGCWLHFDAGFSNLLHDPGVRGIVVHAHDITRYKRHEEHLRRVALRDPLTALPNRAEFMNRLEEALASLDSARAGVAVLFVDLDRFKTINDTFGHTAGDALLVQVSRRIAASLRSDDLLSRYGGDEFVILVEQVNDARVATHVAERVLAALRVPFRLDGRDVTVSASIGVAVGLRAGVKARELLRQADAASHEAKHLGSARYVRYDAERDAEEHTRQRSQPLQIEGELCRALERGEFRLLFQPEVELRTGRIGGYEALVRWQHPQRGLLEPDAFLPAAEQTGLISPLGAWVLRHACRRAVAWQQPGAVRLTLSVRPAAAQLYQPNFVAVVEATLRETGLDPRLLRFEIAEAMLMRDRDVLGGVLEQLGALGVSHVLEGFGSGFSALDDLTRLPVQALTIDGGFVARLGGGAAAAIVSAIATLAHGLGMETIVEGIATADQMAFVRGLHCTRGRGPYFGEPIPAAAALRTPLRGAVPSYPTDV